MKKKCLCGEHDCVMREVTSKDMGVGEGKDTETGERVGLSFDEPVHLNVIEAVSRPEDPARTAAMRRVSMESVDSEIVVRFLPKEFQLLYEALVNRGLALGGNLRGGMGYDETVDPDAGKYGSGGLGSVTSETLQQRLTAKPEKKFGSGKTVIRNEAAVAYRQKMDRKLRKLAREMKLWLNDEEMRKVVKKCINPKCRKFAEEDWWFCPRCGAEVEEQK